MLQPFLMPSTSQLLCLERQGNCGRCGNISRLECSETLVVRMGEFFLLNGTGLNAPVDRKLCRRHKALFPNDLCRHLTSPRRLAERVRDRHPESASGFFRPLARRVHLFRSC